MAYAPFGTMTVWEVFNVESGYSYGYYMARIDLEAIDTVASTTSDPQATKERLWAGRVDMDAAAAAMDDDILDDLDNRGLSPADFLNMYEIQHFNKYREEFVF